MTLKSALTDREYDKFEDVAGQTTVRTKLVDSDITVDAEFSPSGLRNGGRHSFVSVPDDSWVPLPAIPLTDRNGISIQNESGIDVKIRYVDTDPLWRGTRVSGNGGERFYDIKDTIVLYARAESGTAELIIEELS